MRAWALMLSRANTCRADHLRTRSGQFLRAHPLLGDLPDLLAQRRLQIVDGVPGCRRAAEHEQARAAADAVVAGIDIDGDALLAHQTGVQTRSRVAIQHPGQHIEGVGHPVAFGVGEAGRTPRHGQGRLFGDGLHTYPPDTTLGRFGSAVRAAAARTAGEGRRSAWRGRTPPPA
jgi:hypothetical protein